jgi:hypothetical protein
MADPLVSYDSYVENAVGPQTDGQTDRQTDTLIRVGLGNLIRFVQVNTYNSFVHFWYILYHGAQS